jgi:hypothetical protein
MAMTTIKDIFTQYSPEYIQRFGDDMPADHLKVIHAMVHCRSEAFGLDIYKCQDCGKTHIVYRSCGNRHCPSCQHHKTHQWLTRQIKLLVPGHYFMITFTVPEKLRRFIRSHQRIGYSAMFKASSDTIKKLTADPKYIGGDLPGFFGVLHTWGRQLPYHPHIHYVVPGGAFSKNDYRWYCSRTDFFLPVKAMSKIFKAKFCNEMIKHNLYSYIPKAAWDQAWVVNCQAVGQGARSIKYLAPYVFKVAISNSRIVKVENHRVFFKYKKPKSNRWRTTDLDVMEFMRRFLQHVLPKGFMKVRYYGFLHPCSSLPVQKAAVLIELAYGFEIETPETEIEPFPIPTCADCGGEIKLIVSFPPSLRIFYDTS